MIESFTEKDQYTFYMLLTVIWLVILFLFINNSYRNNLSDLQQTIRAALHYTTWDYLYHLKRPDFFLPSLTISHTAFFHR